MNTKHFEAKSNLFKKNLNTPSTKCSIASIIELIKTDSARQTSPRFFLLEYFHTQRRCGSCHISSSLQSHPWYTLKSAILSKHATRSGVKIDSNHNFLQEILTTTLLETVKVICS